jgi:CubicO group peptidase (beta-lactamase class C family)
MALALLCTLPVHAARAPADRDPYAEIASSIEAEIAAGRLTGVSVALVDDGKIVWEDGFGWADRASGRRATSHTPFSIASTSKPFTTTAMMTLVAAGTLELDRQANDYLGAHKIMDRDGPAEGATVRRLATHSSGLPTFFAMYPQGGDAAQPSVPQLLADYGHVVAPPGERYEYSNLGMAVLAHLVARQSGQEFGRYLQSHVFSPLGMHDSFFDTDLARRPEMATRYDDAGEPLPFYLTATPGSGEVYASAHDLARFAFFHLKRPLPGQQKILSDAQLDAMHRPATAIAPHYGYGMGWQVLQRPGQPVILTHGGGQTGVMAEFVLVPSRGVACIIVSNRNGDRDFIHALRDRMLRTVYPAWPGLELPTDPPLAALDPIDAYAGEWRGTLNAQGRAVPVVLTITAQATGTLSLDGAKPKPITALGLVDGLLSGDTRGDIGSPDTRRDHIEQLSLNLKLRGGRIDGEIIAWSKTSRNMTVLPYWVNLHRSDTRQQESAARF